MESIRVPTAFTCALDRGEVLLVELGTRGHYAVSRGGAEEVGPKIAMYIPGTFFGMAARGRA